MTFIVLFAVLLGVFVAGGNYRTESYCRELGIGDTLFILITSLLLGWAIIIYSICARIAGGKDE